MLGLIPLMILGKLRRPASKDKEFVCRPQSHGCERLGCLLVHLSVRQRFDKAIVNNRSTVLLLAVLEHDYDTEAIFSARLQRNQVRKLRSSFGDLLYY